MSRRVVANVVSSLIAVGGGCAAFLAYYRYLDKPERAIDWFVDLGAGVTVGIIFFFAAWGHFQQVTDAPSSSNAFPVQLGEHESNPDAAASTDTARV